MLVLKNAHGLLGLIVGVPNVLHLHSHRANVFLSNQITPIRIWATDGPTIEGSKIEMGFVYLLPHCGQTLPSSSANKKPEQRWCLALRDEKS